MTHRLARAAERLRAWWKGRSSEQSPNQSAGGTPGSPGRRLDSWKEIAAYLDRGIRTVRRWETEEDLPVHRHSHSKGATVHAFTAELNTWRARRNLEPASAQPGSVHPATSQRWMFGGIAVVAVVAAIAGWYLWPARFRAPAVTSLAVLPLGNGTKDPDQAYIADGITDALIGGLTRVRGLRVVSRESTAIFRDKQDDPVAIARRLNTSAVLQGAISRRGERIQVALSMRGATGQQIWNGNYEVPFAQLMEVQDEAVRDLAAAAYLPAPPSTHEGFPVVRTVSTEAWQEYLQGRYLVDQRGPEPLMQGVLHLQKALQLDPSYAPAWAALATAYIVQGTHGGRTAQEAHQLARDASLKAISLDPGLGAAYTTLAAVHCYEWNWQSAQKAFERALQLSPQDADAHQWYATFLALQGKLSQALLEIDRAQQLNPLAQHLYVVRIQILLLSRKYDDAIAQCRTVLAMAPANPGARLYLAIALRLKGRFGEGLAQYETMRRDIMVQPGGKGTPPYLPGEALAYVLAGDRAKGQQLLSQLLAQGGKAEAYEIALTYLALGQHDNALAWLKTAIDSHSPSAMFSLVDPDLDALRGDARFRELVSRFQLPNGNS